MTHQERARTAELIRKLAQRCAFTVIDHDMDFVEQLDAPVSVLHMGRVIRDARLSARATRYRPGAARARHLSASDRRTQSHPRTFGAGEPKDRGSGRNSGAYIYEMFPALARMRSRRGGVLSGGEQQQLAIGRALVSRPRLLMLDEPTEGIQPSIVQQIGEALTRICAELKIAVLLVEQFLEFAWSIAERYYVMQRGRMVSSGGTRIESSESVAHLLSV